MSGFVTRVEQEKEEPYTVIFTTDDHSKYIHIENECRKMIDHEKPTTNGDRIRSMSDEELAGQIAEWNNGDCPPIELCPKRRNEFTHHIECAPWKCWLDWLKEETDNEVE